VEFCEPADVAIPDFMYLLAPLVDSGWVLIDFTTDYSRETGRSLIGSLTPEGIQLDVELFAEGWIDVNVTVGTYGPLPDGKGHPPDVQVEAPDELFIDYQRRGWAPDRT